MLKQISMRLPEKTYMLIEKLSKLEKAEKSSILREAIQKGLDKMKKELAVQLYRENELSISESANLAEISIPEMMDSLAEHGIKSKLTLDDFEQGRKTAEGLF